MTKPYTSPSRRLSRRLSYQEALGRVMGLADFERAVHSPEHARFHLERMGLLAEKLGNPHAGIPTVHVAGTKGKGSTAAMITSMLTSAGFKVGLFTSPHLHSAVERIRIGLEPVTQREFAALVQHIWPVAESVGRDGGYGAISTFELLTAMAFLHFRQAGADFQVVEVGLGGRLDSTNIVSPEVCTITSISLDHEAVLGNTLARIAFEKAGIIKRGVPVVVAPQPSEAMEVFKQIAGEREAPLVQVSSQVTLQKGHAEDGSQSFQMAGLRGHYSLWIPLLGDHQLENASTAVATIETLVNKGFNVPAESIARGLREVRWPGRLQVLAADGPLLVADGAHNPYSAARLVEAVRAYFHFQRLFLIFGSLGGHSVEGMLAELAALSPSVVVVRSRHPRAASLDIISKAVVERGLPLLFQCENVGEATRRTLTSAAKNDLVLATGSLSVAAEVIEEARGLAPELYPSIKRAPDIKR